MSFFKPFFVSLLALVIFSLFVALLVVIIVGGITSKDKPRVEKKSVLVLNLSQHFKEQVKNNFFSALSSEDDEDIAGMYDVVRLLYKAKTDKKISGIYIIANTSPNGFAASNEIRDALIDFKKSGKFVIAHGDIITQKSYEVANIADKIYVSPRGW